MSGAAAAEDAAANGPYLLHRGGAAEIPFFPVVDPILMVFLAYIRFARPTIYERMERVYLKKNNKIKRKRTLCIHMYEMREGARVIYTETPAEIVNITVSFQT